MIWLHVAYYSAVGCAAMVVRDVLGTVLTDAVANGKHKLAGNMDALSDYVNIILASYSGYQLTHMGWQGWVGVLPIGIVGKYATQHATKWSHENLENVLDTEHSLRLESLEKRLDALDASR